MSNRGRSTTGEAAVPSHYPTTPIKEAARHLRLTLSRFLSDRASESEVDEAIGIWASERAKQTAPPRPDVTGATITNKQIDQLWQEAKQAGNVRLATDCAGALLPGRGRQATRGLLRERCAEAWNRKGK